MTELRFAYGASAFIEVDQLVDSAVQAERAGFDVFTVADLPGGVSPLIALTAVARATSTIHVSPFVISAGIWRPETLARDFATLDRASGGRVEVALGSGNPLPPIRALMPGTADGRFDHLVETVATLKGSFGEKGIGPGYVDRPRLFVAGATSRVLRLAAEEADGFIMAGVPPEPKVELPRGVQPLATREATAKHLEKLCGFAGSRADELEICAGAVVIFDEDLEHALAEQAAIHTYMTREEIIDSPKILVGNAEQIADQMLADVRELGITYHVMRGGDPEQLAPALARAKAAVA